MNWSATMELRPERARRFAIAIVAMVVTLVVPPSLIPFANAQAVGTIKTYAGDVRLVRAAHPLAVSTGLAVLRGDRFTTGSNGRLIVELVDQSTIDLYESGKLVLDDHVLSSNGQAKTRISLLAGTLRSIVHITAGAPPNFEVHTPNAIAAARGTDFDTSYHH